MQRSYLQDIAMTGTHVRAQTIGRNRKPKPKRGLSYSSVLLVLMLIVGIASGVVAYRFGEQALQGVNPVPLGGRMPKVPVREKAKPPAP